MKQTITAEQISKISTVGGKRVSKSEINLTDEKKVLTRYSYLRLRNRNEEADDLLDLHLSATAVTVH